MAMTPDPLKLWRDEIGRRMLSLDFVPMGGEPFHATFAPIVATEAVQVAGQTFTPGMTSRDPHLAKDGRDLFALIISSTSGIEANHSGREARIGAGEAVLLRTSRTGTLGAARRHAYSAILMPASLIASRVEGLDDIAVTRIERSNEALWLLRAYLRLLESAAIASEDLRAAAGEHVLNLAKLVLARQSERLQCGEAASVHEVRLRVALDLIDQRFRDPSLSVPDVASAQGISVRYLQKLFEKAGLRFTEHVSELRLAETHRLLSAPGSGERSVLEIAYAAGFSDLSHFNRLFRRRYDATPGAVRSAAARRLPRSHD